MNNYQNTARGSLMGAYAGSGACMQQAAPAPQYDIKSEAAREAHVAEEIGLLQGACGALFEAVDNLIIRLGSVLTPMPSEPKEDCLETFRVPLADCIRTQRRVVQAQVSRLHEIMRALEL